VVSDTGTSFIVGPEREIVAIAQSLGAQYAQEVGIFVLPCKTKVPDLILTFDGIDYHINPDSYLLDMHDPDNPGLCVLGLQIAAPASGVDWILGDVFIRDVYQIYDMGKNRVGMGKAKHHMQQAKFPDEEEEMV